MIGALGCYGEGRANKNKKLNLCVSNCMRSMAKALSESGVMEGLKGLLFGKG
jgi:hypothetical protein